MSKIPFGKPMIGHEEKEAVMKVMDGSILVHGQVSTQFEEQFAIFTGAPHAVSVSKFAKIFRLSSQSLILT